MSLEIVNRLLLKRENIRLEFKEAGTAFGGTVGGAIDGAIEGTIAR